MNIIRELDQPFVSKRQKEILLKELNKLVSQRDKLRQTINESLIDK